jgi:hypothetical protein
MRITLFALTCLLYWNTALSQQKLLKATQQETSAPDKGKLAGKLKDWKVFKFETLTEAMPANTAELVLQLDKSSIILKGQQRALTDGVSKVVELGPGYRREHPFPKLSYFNGKGIRMTMGRDFILGEYTEKGKKFIVEQLGNFIPGADKKQVVVYAATDVIVDLPSGCGADAAFHQGHNPQTESAFLPNTKTNQALASCRVVDIAVMANSTSYAEHGSSVEETAAYIASIYNLSEGDYTNAFSQDFSFKINELVVSTSALTDPWQHTDDIYKNLENFWFFAANEFRSAHDLSSYWFKTNSFAGGVIGLAYLGFTCNTVGDAAIREFKGSAQTMRCLLSHEIGHNFNMSHDAAGSPFIMAPSISGSKQFSDASKTSFETFVSSGSAACIADCNFDACERTLISGLQVTHDKATDKLSASWTKVTGSNGYSIRWWERGSGLSNTALVDSNTFSFSIPLNCNNTLLYRVEVANICSNGQAGTYTGVEIANSNIPQISLDGPDIICAGATTLLRSSVDNGNQWYRDGVEITGATGKTLSVSEGGSYTVRVRRDAGCAFTSNELFIIQNTSVNRPVLSAMGNTTFCEGTGVTLASTAANSYQWLLDGAEIPGETQRSIVAKLSGNYSVRVENEALCIVLSDTIQVTAIPKPAVAVITANRLPQLCPGDAITLSSSAVSGNQWFRNNVLVPGANGNSFQTSEAGTYTVRVTNDFQCSSESGEYMVSLSIPPPKPVVTAEGPLAFCAGNAVTLRSDATEGNQWLLDGVLINGASGVTYKAEKAGRYTVQVTNAAGCSIASDQITVNINALPAIPTVSTSGSTKLCAGSKITLTSSASIGNQWLKDGVAVAAATGNSIEVSEAGKYSVQVSNASGCSVQSPITEITTSALPAKPVITAGGPVTFCAGNNVVLTSNAATGNQWLKDGAVVNNATGNTLQVTQSGVYSVRVTNASGCVSEASGSITVAVSGSPAKPVITAGGPVTFCVGNNVTLTSNAAAGNQWLLDGVLINGANGSTYKAEKAGKYTVQVTNTAGCSNVSDQVTVTIHALPAVPAVSASGGTSLCAGKKITLTSSAATGNQWLKDGVLVSGATGRSIEVGEAGKYSVRVSNASGCSVLSPATDITIIALPATPVITAGGPVTFCAGNTVVLTSNAATGNQWLKDGAVVNNATGNTLQVTQSGVYSVRVTNANGCVSETAGSVTVTVNSNPAKPPINWNGTEFSTLAGFPGYKWFKDGVEIAGAAANVYKPIAAGNYKTSVIDVNACTSISDEYPLVITGITDIRIAGASIKTYPNPARESLFVQVDRAGLVKIQANLFDMQGRMMIEKILVEGRNFISTGNLPSGLYILQLSHGKEKTFTKIVVTK